MAKFIFLKGKIFNGRGYAAGETFEASPDEVRVLSPNSFREAPPEVAPAPEVVSEPETEPIEEETKPKRGRPKKSD